MNRVRRSSSMLFLDRRSDVLNNRLMDKVHTIVVGAGVVGLAIAARLARSHQVLVLEKEAAIGQGISSRNSEVIHAGIYYSSPLKAQLCVRGKSLLYEYCSARQIPHQKTGKLIVATGPNDISQLEALVAQAEQNGVMDLEALSAKQINNLEPCVKGTSALLSPSTGIVSAHDLMLSLSGDISNSTGDIATRCKVLSIEQSSTGFTVDCLIQGESYILACEQIVVATGLDAQSLVESSSISAIDVPALYPCRGRYYSYAAKPPFKHLVYPVPEQNMVGLGIHATLDLGGQVKFGPDTEYVEHIDYSIPNEIPEEYVEAVRRYFPALDVDALQPGYVGIRPKLSREGEAVRDFVIEGESHHGVSGYVQLFGIESPGLTASLAIAEYVESIL